MKFLVQLNNISYFLVIPDKPNITLAKIDLAKCLHVTWSSVEAGGCGVAYTLKYNGSVVVSETGELEYKDCDTIKYNTTTSSLVSVQATVNSNSSGFSEPLNTTIVVLATTLKPLTEPGMLWSYNLCYNYQLLVLCTPTLILLNPSLLLLSLIFITYFD